FLQAEDGIRDFHVTGVQTCALPILFGPVGEEIHNVEFLVFDRWGEVIFRSADPQPLWDGSAKGKRVPVGTYVWQCNFRPIMDIHGAMGEMDSMMGHVTVIH